MEIQFSPHISFRRPTRSKQLVFSEDILLNIYGPRLDAKWVGDVVRKNQRE